MLRQVFRSLGPVRAGPPLTAPDRHTAESGNPPIPSSTTRAARPFLRQRDWHGACCSQLPKELAMVQGLITSADVLWHAPTIIRGFGLRSYLRCLAALLSRRRTTFLELVCSP